MTLRRLAAVTVVLAVGLAACSSGSSSSSATKSSTTTAPTTTTAPPVLDAAALTPRLLQLADLPSGYSVSTGDSTTDTSVVGDLGICGKPGLKEASQPTGYATVTYQGGQLGPFLFQGLSAYPDKRTAASVMDRAKSDAGSCTEFTQTESDGSSSKFTIAPLSSAAAGDDTAAYRLTTSTDGANANLDLVLIRKGRIITVLGDASILSIFGGSQVPPGTLDQLATKALDRIADISG